MFLEVFFVAMGFSLLICNLRIAVAVLVLIVVVVVVIVVVVGAALIATQINNINMRTRTL
jgi:hypothetical protein